MLNDKTDILLDGFNKEAAEQAPEVYKDLLTTFKDQKNYFNEAGDSRNIKDGLIKKDLIELAKVVKSWVDAEHGSLNIKEEEKLVKAQEDMVLLVESLTKRGFYD